MGVTKMKNASIAVILLSLSVTATPAFDYIEQSPFAGNAPALTIDSVDLADLLVPVTDAVQTLRSADLPAATILQTGQNQAADIVQRGRDNLGLIVQQGVGNAASLSQSGARHLGFIHQVGTNNAAFVRQVGAGHMAVVAQRGTNNVAIIRQY